MTKKRNKKANGKNNKPNKPQNSIFGKLWDGIKTASVMSNITGISPNDVFTWLQNLL